MCIYNRRHSTSSHTQLLATVICCSLCFDISLNYESSFMYRYTPEIDRCGLASCQRANTHTHTVFIGIHAFVRSFKLINRWHCPSEKQTEKTDTERHRLNNYRFVRCLCVCACMRISVVIRCSVSFVRCLRFCCGAVWALTHHVRLVVFAPIDILTELKYNPCVCTLLPCME